MLGCVADFSSILLLRLLTATRWDGCLNRRRRKGFSWLWMVNGAARL